MIRSRTVAGGIISALALGLGACGPAATPADTPPSSPSSVSTAPSSSEPSTPAPTSTSPTSTPPTVGVTPTSGTWEFILEEAQTSCVGNQPLIASGPFELVADDSVATWLIDGNTVGFARLAGSTAMYRSATRLFPVQTSQGGVTAGTVYFDFVANTPDAGVGTIHWDNGIDCVGDYPFSIVLEVASALTAPPPTSLIVGGQWTIDLDSPLTDCEGLVSDFGGFTGLPLDSTVELVEGTPFSDGSTAFVMVLPPGDIVMASAPGGTTFVQVGGLVDVGQPLAANGDLLLDYSVGDFTVQWELEALGPDSLTGTMYFTNGTCAGYSLVSLSLA
jgi:hypothetical protein